MGKTRYLFKKVEIIKGKFPASMGLIKDRKSNDLTEAEEIKNTQNNSTKKFLMTQITKMLLPVT